MKNTGFGQTWRSMVKGFSGQRWYNQRAIATRVDFQVKNGYLVTNDGYRVQGRNKCAAFTAAEQTAIGDIRLDVEPRPTGFIWTMRPIFSPNKLMDLKR